MANDSNDGQPSIEKLTSEGVSIRKCIASGDQYGGGSGSAQKPKPALAGMKMKGGY